MAKLPLVAILRGVASADAPLILEALLDEGFVLVEIPLNSPNPLASIEAMRRKAPAEVFIGAGTVLRAADLAAVADAGGDLIVTPNAEPTVIAAAKGRGLICLPGVATPTEAFAALRAGADGLKAFPAEMIGPAVVKAWRAVIPAEVPILPVGGIGPQSLAPYVAAGASGFGLGPDRGRSGPAVVKAWRAVIPAEVPILPVGGIGPQSLAPYVAAGASGFGLGSALYRPGDAPAAVRERAAAFGAAWRAIVRG